MPCDLLTRHVAIAAFGMGTWLSVNAVFVQLPLFVNAAPEGWNLSTYIVLIVQISCFFPLIYGLIDWKFRTNKRWSTYNRTILIPIMLLMSGSGLFMAGFVYDKPSTISGSTHSYLLFVAFFIMSLPCTVSDVMFMPYINRIEGSNIVTTFFVGMGLSALVPSATSLVQGSNVDLNGTVADPWGATPEGGLLFGARSFLVAMAGVCGIALIGFIGVARQGDHSKNKVAIEKQADDAKPCFVDAGDECDFNIDRKRASTGCTIPESATMEVINPFKWRLLLAISLLLGAIQNSVVPVILPYAMQPYGQNMYHIASSLYVMVNPIFCFIQFFLEFRKTSIFVMWTIFNFSLVTFAFVCALLSIKLSGVGPILCVVFSLASGFISWERTAVAHILRQSSSEEGLFWCGAFTQIGSFLGAILMFLLGNVAHIFA